MIDLFIARHETYLHSLLNNDFILDKRLNSALTYSLFPGGKRIRPLLVYLLGELIDIDLRVLDVIAASIELTHTYSLIHDDLPAMDNDDFRRGKPSCHIAYDQATAILLGDGLQALAIELLLTKLSSLVSDSQCIVIASELIKASGLNGMVRGQNLDLTLLNKPNIAEDQLQEVHQLKTGKLIATCAEMVLATTDSLEEWIPKAFRSYISHLGLVFQMQDDYLDCFALRDVLGKRRSSDTINQKTTYATLFSKQQLEDKINHQYEIAFAALKPFDDKAAVLRHVTEELSQRHLRE